MPGNFTSPRLLPFVCLQPLLDPGIPFSTSLQGHIAWSITQGHEAITGSLGVGWPPFSASPRSLSASPAGTLPLVSMLAALVSTSLPQEPSHEPLGRLLPLDL